MSDFSSDENLQLTWAVITFLVTKQLHPREFENEATSDKDENCMYSPAERNCVLCVYQAPPVIPVEEERNDMHAHFDHESLL